MGWRRHEEAVTTSSTNTTTWHSFTQISIDQEIKAWIGENSWYEVNLCDALPSASHVLWLLYRILNRTDKPLLAGIEYSFSH